jgi:hypothetical protein
MSQKITIDELARHGCATFTLSVSCRNGQYQAKRGLMGLFPDGKTYTGATLEEVVLLAVKEPI